MVEKGHFEELKSLLEMINLDEEKKKLRQTFVFSATLTLIHELPKHQRDKKKSKNLTTEEKLQSVRAKTLITVTVQKPDSVCPNSAKLFKNRFQNRMAFKNWTGYCTIYFQMAFKQKTRLDCFIQKNILFMTLFFIKQSSLVNIPDIEWPVSLMSGYQMVDIRTYLYGYQMV
jgi:hypothetical protein